MTKEQEEHVTLEEHLGHLEEILDQMEQPEVSLEQSFELYKKGIGELKSANAMVDEIEKAMLVIAGDGSLETF